MLEDSDDEEAVAKLEADEAVEATAHASADEEEVVVPTKKVKKKAGGRKRKAAGKGKKSKGRDISGFDSERDALLEPLDPEEED